MQNQEFEIDESLRPESRRLFERALRVIPGGVNSPVRAFRSVGGTPVYMHSGAGCRLRDVDGNEYIDFCNSWGPLLVGHRHPGILHALQDQLDRALSFGTPCEEEALLAELAVSRLHPRVPGVERIRFTSSGTEAVMSALRLARGFTGRNKIVKFAGCYHGHVDSMLVKAGSGLATLGTPDSAGVPAAFSGETIVLPLDDEEALDSAFLSHGDDIAAIIIEPVPANNGLLLQRPEFLQRLRTLSERAGALLIFDEVISGFRIGFGGAAERYGITPDLATYGKIIGGGMPVGAFAGRADIFQLLAPDGPVYQAGTLSGNPVAMSAGLAQLRLLTPDVYDRLESLGAQLQEGFESLALPWHMSRIDSIFWLYRGNEAPRRADQIDRDAMKVYAHLFHFMLARGIYLAPSGYEVGFLSTPMAEAEIDRLLDSLREFFQRN
ncbi:MAG: glutamate-1-semialdehyde 2,1-aminomutase [Leptospirales bacterium]|nr:glutamate-1-semialdehyde 2,1-aminomutase [Leptospirales bacterium]